jgi:2-C-methyl-D-erythritol 4-phosphate cytidylyltransferase
MTSGFWTVIVAAGRSSRFGAPKLLEPLGGQRVIDHAVATAVAVSDGVVLVADDPRVSDGQPVDAVVGGGTSRSGSVRAGLAVVPDGVAMVLVHDGARPGADADLYLRVADALVDGVDAVVPVVPVVDTIKRIDAARKVTATVDRSDLVAVQTPQGFRRSVLVAAHGSDGEATDDAALIELAGGTVVAVQGDAMNVKVTETNDLEFLRAVWKR